MDNLKYQPAFQALLAEIDKLKARVQELEDTHDHDHHSLEQLRFEHSVDHAVLEKIEAEHDHDHIVIERYDSSSTAYYTGRKTIPVGL